MHEPSSPLRHSPSPASGKALESLLDADTLAQLRQLDPQGRNKLLDRVLGAYAQSLEKLLAQLPQAPAPDDAQNIRQLAHTLKSSSASVGALRMSQHCAAVEKAIRDGQTDQWQQELPLLCAEAQRLLQGLAQAGFALQPGAPA